ncbi:MAG: YiiX/YebB-like N1pC/P60 family cysteine hydrolase [Lentimicrobium sp.]
MDLTRRTFRDRMIIRKMLPLAFLMLAVIGLMLGQSADRNLSGIPAEATPLNESPALPALNDGDIIFRKGRSLVSAVVMMNDPTTAFSHVGIVVHRDGEPFIIHAVPGEPDENGDEKVRCDKTADFISHDKASRYAVYRLCSDTAGFSARAASKAMEYYHEKLAFDKAFNIKSDDRLYCTELVWKAYLSSGINLTGSHFTRLSMNFLADSLILPGQLLNSSLLKEIHVNH